MFPGADMDGEGNEADQPRRFQVNVTVLEGRHLAVMDGNSRITITLGRHRRTSRSKTLKTDCPYFNEFFFFAFQTPLSLFLDEILRVELYRVRRFKSDKLIGGFSVELATVWFQPNHLFRHKWAILTDPNNPTAGVKGYLKCDIAILAKSTGSKPLSHDPGERIEDHLMVPYGEVEDRQRAKFVFSIFRADNFSPRSEFPAPPDPYVTVTFGGVSHRTTVEKKTETPLWNQELVFVDMIPTLYQYVRVEMCDASRSSSNRVLGGAQLDLREISHESEKGFLPTYGPSFLYFYKNLSKFELHNKCCSLGRSCTYVGRLLMALRTEVVDYAEDVYVRKKRAKKLSTKMIPPLMESRYFDYKEFVFFASIFDVLLFNRRLIGSKISVRVSIGPSDSTLKKVDQKSEMQGKGERGRLLQEKPRSVTLSGRKETQNEDNLKANEVFSVQDEIPEKESTTVQNFKPSRAGRKEIIRLPRKGFVYVNTRRETIRQLKFFKSLDEWPKKEITRENFKNFPSHLYRRKKIPDGKDSKNSTGRPPEVSRMSKHYRRMKSILAGKNSLKTSSKRKYLRIKTLLRRGGRESRFATNARTRAGDGDGKNGTKRSRPRISKPKEWTVLKRIPRRRAEKEIRTSSIRARKPKNKKRISVHGSNRRTPLGKREYSWSPDKGLRKTGNETESLGSETQEMDSEKSMDRSGITRSACTYIMTFSSEKTNCAEYIPKAEENENDECSCDEPRKSEKRNSKARKLNVKPDVEAVAPKKDRDTQEPDELEAAARRKFVPVRKMNWENSFRRQEFSLDFKTAKEWNSHRKSEKPGTKGSSVGTSRKWSPRSGYIWLKSLSSRKRGRGGSSYDMAKVSSTGDEEMKESRIKRISQGLKLPGRRREKPGTEEMEASDMSPKEAHKLRKEAERPDRDRRRKRTTQYAEHSTESRTDVEAGRRKRKKPEENAGRGGGASTKREKSVSRERNLEFAAKAWKSLPRRIREKFLSNRGRDDAAPERRRKTEKKLRERNSIFGILGKWSENGRKRICRLQSELSRSSSRREKGNVESEKSESTKTKIRRLFMRSSRESAKSRSHITGKGKERKSCRENSRISRKVSTDNEKSMPPKRITGTSSCVVHNLSDAGNGNPRKVKRGRRRETCKLENEDSNHESSFDSDLVRHKCKRRGNQIEDKRKKKSRDSAKLGKGVREHLADPVVCEADDESRESENTSDDSSSLNTRCKRYHKRKSSKRGCKGFESGTDDRKGMRNADNVFGRCVTRESYEPKLERQISLLPVHNLIQGKIKMQPVEAMKEMSRSEEITQTDFAVGGQKNFFVFYSLQKNRPIVSEIKPQSDRVGKKKEEGDDKSPALGSQQELVGADSRAEGSELKSDKGEKNSEGRERNVMGGESDYRSNASGDATTKEKEGGGEGTNSFGKRSAEFPAKSPTNGKPESTKAAPSEMAEKESVDGEYKGKQIGRRSNTEPGEKPQDEAEPMEEALGNLREKSEDSNGNVKSFHVDEIESDSDKFEIGYSDEESDSSESQRKKSRKREKGKNGRKSKEGKPGKKRNGKRKRKALEGSKISNEKREKGMTSGARHLTVYNDCNTTDLQSVKMLQHYGHSNFSGKFPCLHIVGSWPDARRRMYRTNIVQNSIKTFTAGIREVENELQSENKIEASAKMKNILGGLSKDCREILRLTEKVEPQDTNLWREKKKFYHREIREIIFKADSAVQRKVLTPEEELNRSYNYLTTIRRFAQDPEDSFPDTEIWLLKNKQSIAQYRMRTRKIVYSPDASERGSKSGRIQSIVFRSKNGGIVAKLEMFMWFGLGSHFADCKKMLPPGFQHSRHSCPGTDIDIPETLRYENFLFFQCRIYVSQAVILQSFDATGFADPFVRIVLDGRFRDTQTLTTTLNPIWNEMLVFQDVKVHWPPVYVKDNSIAVTVEVFDFHFASRPELIGRTVIKPTVKLANGESSSADFPVRFSWEGIRGESNETGKILIAAELLEKKQKEEIQDKKAVLPIPEHIRPSSVSYRLEVLFWGVRELSKKHVGTRCKAYVAMECAGKVLTSPPIKISGEATNFPGIVQTLDLELPQEDEYKPPLIMKLTRANAIRGFMGKCIIPNVKAFFCPTVDDEERIKQEIAYKKMQEESNKLKEVEEREARENESMKRKRSVWRSLKLILLDFQRMLQYLIVITYKGIRSKMAGTYVGVKYSLPESGAREPSDWWTKYYTSKYKLTGSASPESIVIYDEELEAQPEFGGFSDYIYAFNVTAGKMKKKAEKEIFVGKVKAAIKLYRWPLEEHHYETLYGVNIKMGLLKHLPSNTAIKYIVRAYVISCTNLTPKDIFGKSDPYLLLKLGKQKISDSKNYIRKDVNPTFGKCFEFVGIFPKEHLLSVRVMDHRTITSDDLIGETRIDLESRYYTKHHASCGISATYSRMGYNFWRDAYRPTELLKSICKRSHLPEPVYTESCVIIGEHRFQNVSQDNKNKTEAEALNVLHKWHEIPFRGFHLVPEHVETRALYHPSYPGIEQGKVEMWIDIFPADLRYVPPVIDITPRKPVDMELRAIVWNVENVTLGYTSYLTGERMSDILVEGWMSALEEDRQATDVHYRSLNGRGNFNWRFIFPFKYAEAERRLVIQRQDPLFKTVEETKYPCRLELHVLDNDLFKQDFLGSLNLELCSMPRGAKISTLCDLSMLEETTPKMDLFKIRRTRGWWPFKKVLDEESNEYKLAGKIELELEVLTKAEASENPVGKGRKEPRALPEPKRPDTSLFWLTNPLNTFRHIICRKFGKYIAVATLTALLVLFFGLGIYSIPGYAVKRMLGA